MRVMHLRKWFLSLALTAAAAWATLPNAVGYCATCYLGAAGIGDKGIRALQMGIVVLMIPTATILGGILWCAFRYRDSDSLPECQSPEELQGNRWEERFGEASGFAATKIPLPAVNPN